MKIKAKRWLLPEGVDEVLPPQAGQLDALQRELLDLYRSWGYDLVHTPLIEFLDSLLVSNSQDLNLSTFKLVDQLSGKSMGVRADISSQIARIDAHVLQNSGPSRLCYADNVLRTRPNGPMGSRCPLLIGAELYGYKTISADIEAISLMLHTLRLAGIKKPLLALGHSNICRTLLKLANLSDEVNQELFIALQNKASSDVERILAGTKLKTSLKKCLSTLPSLFGDKSILPKARKVLGKLSPEILSALNLLSEVVTRLQKIFPDQEMYFDLCELGGYEYHSGLIFSAYVVGHGQAIARGGRYDTLAQLYGHERAATGFDADLKTLIAIGNRNFSKNEKIYAPVVNDPIQEVELDKAILELRLRGQIVIKDFPSTGESPIKPDKAAAILNCTQKLTLQQGRWVVEPLL
jgi:ATP phosphoribosyltransferase regulatory subunit